MGGEWAKAKLGSLLDVKHGFAFKGEFFRDDPPGDILLTPGNFAIGGGFKDDKFKYYDGPVPEEFFLQEGDLLVTMTDLSKNTDTLGYPALVPRASNWRRYLHNQRLGKILVKDTRKTHPRFLYYVLCTSDYRHEIVASATGTTVKHTSPARIQAFEVLLPPLREQQAIACILGSLDDKIELNRRMNRTLEEMTRAIFKSWFIDFDPVRAKARVRREHPKWTDEQVSRAACPKLKPEIARLFPDSFEPSELGEIPKGWKARPLPAIVAVNPPRSITKGTLAPYLDMANMPTQGPSPDLWVMRAVGSGMKFINGDTLVARITPCLENGKTAYVDFLPDGGVGWGSTEYIVLRPKGKIPPLFAYLLARTEEFRTFAIHQMTGSSGRQRVPAASLEKYFIITPETESPLFQHFGVLVSPMFNRIRGAAKESRTLAALRDALLPKLISGELRIKDAERIAQRKV